MDGNGRWAKARNLPRTEGHARGEASLFDVIEGAIEIGVKYLSAYAFSTENWNRSPDEVRWLMGFNRDVIRRRRDQLDAMGVRVRWAGRSPRLWRSVITELQDAERRTVDNVLTLQFCVNYGGRAEIVDAARRIAQLAAEGRLDPRKLTEERFRHFLDEPEIPDVDLFVRSSGEQRTSNFLLWQSAYAELVFLIDCGPISTAVISGGRSSCTRSVTGAMAEQLRMRWRLRSWLINRARAGRLLSATCRHPDSGRALRELLTGVAGAEDLEVVADFAEAVLLGHRIGPSLDRRSRDLDRTTADAADQMMVMPVEQRRYAVSPSLVRMASRSPASVMSCRVR